MMTMMNLTATMTENQMRNVNANLTEMTTGHPFEETLMVADAGSKELSHATVKFSQVYANSNKPFFFCFSVSAVASLKGESK
jgi:hypothetical protein